jgi:drug/metabolite transporter (DMT)-like permease
LLSALCGAIGVVATRRMGSADRADTNLFWTAVIALAVLSLAIPFGFVVPSAPQLLAGAAMGACYGGAQYCLLLAYRRAEASLLAPFSYAQLLSSTALSYLGFGVMPDQPTLIGGLIIVLSGVYIAYRERARRRERAEAGI